MCPGPCSPCAHAHTDARIGSAHARTPAHSQCLPCSLARSPPPKRMHAPGHSRTASPFSCPPTCASHRRGRFWPPPWRRRCPTPAQIDANFAAERLDACRDTSETRGRTVRACRRRRRQCSAPRNPAGQEHAPADIPAREGHGSWLAADAAAGRTGGAPGPKALAAATRAATSSRLHPPRRGCMRASRPPGPPVPAAFYVLGRVRGRAMGRADQEKPQGPRAHGKRREDPAQRERRAATAGGHTASGGRTRLSGGGWDSVA